MDRNDERLAHALKLRFGTAPNEPTESQLRAIKCAIRELVSSGRVPTDGDWFEVVRLQCPSAGSYGYKGADNSDLIALLRLASSI